MTINNQNGLEVTIGPYSLKKIVYALLMQDRNPNGKHLFLPVFSFPAESGLVL
jgi:hypothetical protein